MATITLAVTVVNVGGANYYFIDGSQQAGISAIPGNTYKFDQADSSNSGHPLRLSITSNGTHAGGSAYTDGVTTSGTPGNAGAYTQIVVDATTVQTLYYYCTQHSNMGGPFNVGSSSTVKLKDIKGFTVQSLASDPTTPASVGQFYFNSTSKTFKYVQPGGVATATWASGGDLSNSYPYTGGAGTQGAALSFGGYPNVATSEAYDGTSWTATNTLNTARYQLGGSGAFTAAITVGGQPSTAAETFNGTSWTSVPSLATARGRSGVTGNSSSALCAGGFSNPGTYQAINEKYDGSSWTEVANLSTPRANQGSAGTSTAALTISGNGGSGVTVNVEQWNGSGWTEIANVNRARDNAGSGGTVSTALYFGGEPAGENTEYYDGTSWTEVANLGTDRYQISRGNVGTATLGICIGGTGPNPSNPILTVTEEWTVPDLIIKTVTTS